MGPVYEQALRDIKAINNGVPEVCVPAPKSALPTRKSAVKKMAPGACDTPVRHRRASKTDCFVCTPPVSLGNNYNRSSRTSTTIASSGRVAFHAYIPEKQNWFLHVELRAPLTHTWYYTLEHYCTTTEGRSPPTQTAEVIYPVAISSAALTLTGQSPQHSTPHAIPVL